LTSSDEDVADCLKSRLLEKEIAILDKDRTILELQRKVQELEFKVASAEPEPRYVQEAAEDDDSTCSRTFATDADVDVLCRKSAALLHSMAAPVLCATHHRSSGLSEYNERACTEDIQAMERLRLISAVLQNELQSCMMRSEQWELCRRLHHLCETDVLQ
jgi:hypothetical protein